MTDPDATEFRDDIKQVIRNHDITAGDLRALAADLETLADEWDAMDETL